MSWGVATYIVITIALYMSSKDGCIPKKSYSKSQALQFSLGLKYPYIDWLWALCRTGLDRAEICCKHNKQLSGMGLLGIGIRKLVKYVEAMNGVKI